MNVKNTNVSGAAFLIGQLRGGATATISNVTIKDSTIIGHRSVGALVGALSGTLKIGEGIYLDNVDVQVVGGRSGMLVGLIDQNVNIQFTGDGNEITMKDCSYGIFDCAQTTGTVSGTQLGLDSAEGVLYSHLTDKNTIDQQHYVANALMLRGSATEASKATASRTNGTYYKYNDVSSDFNTHVTGWN